MMRLYLLVATLALLNFIACTQSTDTGSTGTVETIEGHKVVRFSSNGVELAHVDLGNGAWAVFKPKSPGTGGGGIDGNCLACKISQISTCANEVCPPIKENNPEASCSDEISACTAEKCKDKCKAESIGAFYGSVIQ